MQLSPLSHSAVGTILVGMATPQQFDDALAAVGPPAARRPRPTDNAAQAFAGEQCYSAGIAGGRKVDLGISVHGTPEADTSIMVAVRKLRGSRRPQAVIGAAAADLIPANPLCCHGRMVRGS